MTKDTSKPGGSTANDAPRAVGSTFQMQARICPQCHDDHSEDRPCAVSDTGVVAGGGELAAKTKEDTRALRMAVEAIGERVVKMDTQLTRMEAAQSAGRMQLAPSDLDLLLAVLRAAAVGTTPADEETRERVRALANRIEARRTV